MKRIVTCSDGTWNNINPDRSTNVVKIFNAICKEDIDKSGNKVIQVKSYDEGVGTGYKLKDKLFGGATGSGIDTNIKDMYVFVMLNYEPGDQLYFFGFSRGAYTARSLAGLIRNSGVLKPQYLHFVDKAYDLYRDKNEYSSPDSDLMESFRKRYSVEENTQIHFIGVWDTVGALGIPLPWYKMLNMKKYSFHDVKLGKYVTHAYQALAIDEKRKLFEPTLWTQANSVIANPGYPQQLEQRWFAGSHSNVGGGLKDSKLSNHALQWLFDKAGEAGLCFNKPPLIKEGRYDKGKVENSYGLPYWFWMPRPRKPLTKKFAKEFIDESAFELLASNKGYHPAKLSVLYNLKRKEGQPPVKTLRFGNVVQGIPNLIFYYLLVYIIFLIIYLKDA